jgi:hypothetical protein
MCRWAAPAGGAAAAAVILSCRRSRDEDAYDFNY